MCTRISIVLSAVLLLSPALPLHAAEVNVTLGIDPSHVAGTDSANRVLLFTPNPLQQGSSVSHWDSSAFPNLLMEPSTSSSLGFAQIDLTRPQLLDIGWPAGNANIVLRVQDGPGEGFNDPSLGSQRMSAMQFVANFWGNRLGSSVTINIDVEFRSLECSNGGGVLAQAGPQFLFESFAGAPFGSTWYHGALAESLSGQNLSLDDDPNPNAGDIAATFNSQIDEGCLGPGSRYHYGLNAAPAGTISFVNVALHEVAHGLGFATLANSASGALFLGMPDIYNRFTYDNTQDRHWHQMTNAQRQISAVNSRRVAWSGAQVTAQAANFLNPAPALRINSPSGIAGFLTVGIADFGPPLSTPGVTGNVAIATDGSAAPTLACNPLVNTAQINGNIALVDRGTCLFVEKVKNAQNAGARGVIVVNNVAGNPINMGGTDPTITIPSLSISRNDGNDIKNALNEPDPPGGFRFSMSNYSVREGAGSATITVERTGGDSGEVRVSYATSDGTANAGTDYQATSGTLTWGDGDSAAKTFQVTIFDDMQSEDPETVNLALANPTGGATLGTPKDAVLTIGDNEPCVVDATTMCLSSGRFRLRVTWRDFEGGVGDGQRVETASDDSGLFWFFDPDNWEMLVKVLDGCGFNDRFWVFSAATTNVEYTLRVTDTETGAFREYTNPLGVRSDAITDIDAFESCP